MDSERKDKIARQIKMLLALKFKKDDPLPAEIAPNVFIGSIGAALNKNYLTSNAFTHILVVADNIHHSFSDLFTYKSIEILDTIDYNILKVFDEAIEFIDSSLNSNGRILVHCFAGKSRSGAICCAYLMKRLNMRLEQALKHIIERRPQVMPNPGFLFQLGIFEKNLFPVDLEELN